LHASSGGRFFAWVIGGTLPAAIGADWLTTVWDQNAPHYSTSPAAAVCEAFFSGTTWRGERAMRVSVVSWKTTNDDVDRVVNAIAKVLAG
jgi:hypothetical protein